MSGTTGRFSRVASYTAMVVWLGGCTVLERTEAA